MTERPRKTKVMNIKSEDRTRHLAGELTPDKDVPDGKVRIRLEGGFAGEGESLCDTCIYDPATCGNEFNRTMDCDCGEVFERSAEELRAGNCECPKCGQRWKETPVFCHWYDEDASQITDGITTRRGFVEWDADRDKVGKKEGEKDDEERNEKK